MSEYENRPNTGALFKRGKRSEKAPDYSGPFYGPDGEELEISAWERKSKRGEAYMSVKVSDRFVPQKRDQPPAQQRDDFDDDRDIPF